jgi:hypothetical protein
VHLHTSEALRSGRVGKGPQKNDEILVLDDRSVGSVTSRGSGPRRRGIGIRIEPKIFEVTDEAAGFHRGKYIDHREHMASIAEQTEIILEAQNEHYGARANRTFGDNSYLHTSMEMTKAAGRGDYIFVEENDKSMLSGLRDLSMMKDTKRKGDGDLLMDDMGGSYEHDPIR